MKENCEICGCALTDANRSKSYVNRCKQCVAAGTKAKRDQKKQQDRAMKTKEENDASKFIRPLKFRAQDFTHTWHTGFVAAGNVSAVLFPKYPDGRVDLGIQIYVLPETVTQFTGLYDKNGREIYEGDIVRLTNENLEKDVICLVVFRAGSFMYRDSIHADWHMCSEHILLFDVEVIGNIFDDPDLLQNNPKQ